MKDIIINYPVAKKLKDLVKFTHRDEIRMAKFCGVWVLPNGKAYATDGFILQWSDELDGLIEDGLPLFLHNSVIKSFKIKKGGFLKLPRKIDKVLRGAPDEFEDIHIPDGIFKKDSHPSPISRPPDFESIILRKESMGSFTLPGTYGLIGPCKIAKVINPVLEKVDFQIVDDKLSLSVPFDNPSEFYSQEFTSSLGEISNIQLKTENESVEFSLNGGLLKVILDSIGKDRTIKFYFDELSPGARFLIINDSYLIMPMRTTR